MKLFFSQIIVAKNNKKYGSQYWDKNRMEEIGKKRKYFFQNNKFENKYSK